MNAFESSMISTIRAPTSLQNALAHAILFLTRPLSKTISSDKLITLQHALSSTLTPHLSTSWSPADPSRGSGRRCLTFTPGRTPPRPIFTAAKQAGIDCQTWMTTLGRREFDLFIDPGRVRMRFTGSTTFELVWAATSTFAAQAQTDEIEAPIDVEIRTAFRATMARSTRARLSALLTLRTDLAAFANSSDSDSESDAESEADSIFSAGSSGSSRSSATSASSSCSPCDFSPKITRRTPCITFTPATPINAISNTSSVPFPTGPFITRGTPTKTASPTPSAPVSPCKLSRRERARQRRNGVVTLPPSAPTAYDGGKTNVLGGGVRLGSAAALIATRA